MAGASRYHGVPTACVPVGDGLGGVRLVAYLLPRTPRDTTGTVVAARHRVTPLDRLDLVAAQYLGDPVAAWRIADANVALDPDDLVGPDAEGTVLVIPVPGL